VLGLHPFAGRLTFDEDEPGNAVVLGFDYWSREFGGDRTVVGKVITMQGKPLTIVGIAPPRFFGLRVGESGDLYVPLAPGDAGAGANSLTLGWTQAIGRLKPGVSVEQASSELKPILEEIQRDSEIPAIEQRQEMDHVVLTPAAHGLSSVRSRFAQPARILMGVAALVLLIACSNVANLLLAQGSARRREIALRLAIGAPRRRLARQFLTEGATLAFFGTVAGLFAARWTSRLLVASLSDARNPVTLATPLSARVLLFSLASAILVTLLCGLAPALSATERM
jgi:hypothetical protein